MPSDPPILSAEQHHDGFDPTPSRRDPPAKSNGTKRKLTKADSPGPVSGEEDKKRSRGRPRLDMNDESAADRRRTQIRLAQRAYRDRKESAITTLEKKVKVLETTNSKMSRAFTELYQAAVTSGLATSNPDVGRKMLATMEEFTRLSRRSSVDEILDEEDSAGLQISDAPSLSSGELSRNDSQELVMVSRTESSIPSTAGNSVPSTTASQIHYGGYIISQESYPPPGQLDLTSFNNQQTKAPLMFGSTGPQPTFAGSAFSFNTFSTTASSSPLDPLGSSTSIDLLPPGFSSTSQLYSQPPPTTTYSYLERSFSRHLHRRAVEYCYSLITASSTPPQTLAHVFGFCMLFETPEMIRARLARSVSRTREDFPSNWRYPFVNLGGAGTYTSSTTQPTRESQGDPMKPRHGTGFSQGPFDQSVTKARDDKLGPALKIKIPGFEDAFFDSEDIQEYLADRGVIIPPGMERVVFEVDMDEFRNGNGDGRLAAVGSDEREKLAVAMGTRDVLPGTEVQMPLDPGLTGPPETLSQAWVESSIGMLSTQPSSSNTTEFWDSTSVTPFSGMTNGSTSRGSNGGGRRELVTLDVNTFIHELVIRGSCLGRTPGFRRGDVNEAFLIAAYRGSGF